MNPGKKNLSANFYEISTVADVDFNDILHKWLYGDLSTFSKNPKKAIETRLVAIGIVDAKNINYHTTNRPSLHICILSPRFYLNCATLKK